MRIEIELKRQIKEEARNEFTSGSNSDDVVVRSDVETLFAADSILWYPYEVEDFCWSVAWLLGYKELMALAIELARLFLLITEFGLWGSFLLDSALRASLPEADARRYGKLLETLRSSKPAFASILEMAECLEDAEGDEDRTNAEVRDIHQVTLETTASPVAEVSDAASNERSAYRFHYDARRERWFLRFPGDEECDFDDCMGLQYYCRLLKYEGTPMTATDLTLTDEKVVGKLPTSDKVYSVATRNALRRRIEQLDEKIAGAREAGDMNRFEELDDERNKLKKQLDKDLNKYGQPRRLGPLTGDAKLRHNAKKVMKYTLDNIIGTKMPHLVDYLKVKFTLPSGRYEWCYRNTEHIEWEF